VCLSHFIFTVCFSLSSLVIFFKFHCSFVSANAFLLNCFSYCFVSFFVYLCVLFSIFFRFSFPSFFICGQWQAVVNTVMNFRVPWKAENALSFSLTVTSVSSSCSMTLSGKAQYRDHMHGLHV
jgi:hypothetical protein